MCLIADKRRRSPDRMTRQQKRKLQRDLTKLTGKVRRKAEQTLKDERIPKWIRDVKRRQLERQGLIEPNRNT